MRECNYLTVYFKKQKFSELWISVIVRYGLFGAETHTAAALSPPLKGSSMISHKLDCPLQPSLSKTRENRPFVSTLWILLEEPQPTAITDTGEDSQIGDLSSMIPLNLGNFKLGLSLHVSVSNQMKSLSKD